MHTNPYFNSFAKTVIIVWLVCVNFADAKTVIIDAGHGGKDKGAHWYGVSEKTLTLDVAKRVERPSIRTTHEARQSAGAI